MKPEKGLKVLEMRRCALSRSGSMKALYMGYTVSEICTRLLSGCHVTMLVYSHWKLTFAVRADEGLVRGVHCVRGTYAAAVRPVG